MIVVDTNILVYLYFPGRLTREVEQLLQMDSEWAAPVLWRSELLNVLSTYMRLESLSLARSVEIYELADELMARRTYAVSPLKVLDVAHRTGCSGYDSEFVSLAEDLDTNLITYDGPLLKKARHVSLKPSEYLKGK